MVGEVPGQAHGARGPSAPRPQTPMQTQNKNKSGATAGNWLQLRAMIWRI